MFQPVDAEEQQRLGNHQRQLPDAHVDGDVGHSRERADPQSAIGRRLDQIQSWQMIDVHQVGWFDDMILHQAHEIGAAGDEHDASIARVSGSRGIEIFGGREGEWMHGSAFARRGRDSVSDVGITGAAAKIATQPFTDLGRVELVVREWRGHILGRGTRPSGAGLIQQRDSGHDLPRVPEIRT